MDMHYLGWKVKSTAQKLLTFKCYLEKPGDIWKLESIRSQKDLSKTANIWLLNSVFFLFEYNF